MPGSDRSSKVPLSEPPGHPDRRKGSETPKIGSWEWEIDRDEVLWSAALCEMHGVEEKNGQLSTDEVQELIHPADRGTISRVVRGAIEAGEPFTCEYRIVRPSGEVRTVQVHGSIIHSGEGATRLVGTTEDVTDGGKYEERLWYVANHDSLTGLLNRRQFMEELDREIAMAEREGSGAVLMIDLDRFKDINDSLGHMAGDNLLVRVGEELKSRLRTADRLARLGGDEFAIILPRCNPTSARRVCQRLIEGLHSSATVTIAGRERGVSASVGVALFGGAPASADELLVAADIAMYRGKDKGGDRVEVFDEEMRAELAARVQVETELRHALEQGQIEAFYQPIVSLVDGAPVGCEALARWHHPQRGVLSPGEFIPIAEEYGLIGGIGSTVLWQACSQAAKWRHEGTRAYVSVNVSPLELLREDTADRVASTLERTGLPAPLLQLEVTETSLIDEAAKIAPALQAVKELGVRIAIDDFGGGTSSLAFLSELPIDVIKIDGHFIQRLVGRKDDRAIVAAVLSLAEELELAVIAEAVETERQHRELRELGCRFAQGFLYARPQPAANLSLDGYAAAIQPGVGDPSQIREFMRQVGIPARIGS